MIPCPSFSFSSRWRRSAGKGPYALRPVSQQSPQGCPRNSANICLVDHRSRQRNGDPAQGSIRRSVSPGLTISRWTPYPQDHGGGGPVDRPSPPVHSGTSGGLSPWSIAWLALWLRRPPRERKIRGSIPACAVRIFPDGVIPVT